MAAVSGFDFVVVDQEHVPISAETALTTCAAAERGGAAAVVRVRGNRAPEIQRALNVGAAGDQRTAPAGTLRAQ
jgi:4-hydroxy-2-oxoheptanedioate aldolase